MKIQEGFWGERESASHQIFLFPWPHTAVEMENEEEEETIKGKDQTFQLGWNENNLWWFTENKWQQDGEKAWHTRGAERGLSSERCVHYVKIQLERRWSMMTMVMMISSDGNQFCIDKNDDDDWWQCKKSPEERKSLREVRALERNLIKMVMSMFS